MVVTISESPNLRPRCRAAVLEALEQMGGQGSRREILARAERIAAFSREELALQPPEKARDKYRRLVDYQLSWTLTNLKREGLVENPRWSHWQLRRGDAPAGAEVLAAPTTPTRLRQLKAMPYSEYLKTLEWHRTRLAALERAGHRCQLDASHADRRLDVHHNSYERRGEELAADVIVLCGPCHERHHGPGDGPVNMDPPEDGSGARRSERPSLLGRLLGRR